MTVDEKVKEYLGTGMILHIGSGSGWFFCGTAEQYDREIDEITDGWRKYFDEVLESNENMIYNAMQWKIGAPKDAKPKDFVQLLREKAHTIETILARIPKYKKIIGGFIPFRNRFVKEVYDRLEPNTVAIVTTGSEVGIFWDMEDWDKAKTHYPVADITPRVQEKKAGGKK